MRDWDKELEEIFADPIFANVKPNRPKPTTHDRLIDGFNEVVNYVRTHGKMPCADGTPEERTLYNRLQGVLSDPEKMERCRAYDTENILPQQDRPEEKEETQNESHTDDLAAILSDPIFDSEEPKDDTGIYDLPDYMQNRLKERREADYIGKRTKCEDFDRYEKGFLEVHKGLSNGKFRLIKFRQAHLVPGRYFVENGIMFYMLSCEQLTKDGHGNADGRTRIIYENGLESDVLFRTLTKNLAVTGLTVQDVSELPDDYLKAKFEVSDKDVESGIIYVLRSLSTRKDIQTISNLYKIGFTTTSVESRIAGAEHEPTYLCAPVEIVATWKVYNVKSSVFENLIHKLFDCVQLRVIVDGVMPKEWFKVPLPAIREAVQSIIAGHPIEYNPNLRQIVFLD